VSDLVLEAIDITLERHLAKLPADPLDDRVDIRGHTPGLRRQSTTSHLLRVDIRRCSFTMGSKARETKLLDLMSQVII
jgi:hypothetical protein